MMSQEVPNGTSLDPKLSSTLKGIADTSEEIDRYFQMNYRGLFDHEELNEIWKSVLHDIGLRLRPFFLRITYEAGKRVFKDVLPIAAGVELIQISTLVIDDVLDKSLMRNRKPSLYDKYGVGKAISVGTIISSIGFNTISSTLRKAGLENGIDVLGYLTEIHKDIYVGQFMDIDFEKNISISEKKFIEMISKTTACFIQAPLVIGAMLWNAPEDLISVLKEIGMNLGIAYQLRDDVLDIIGDPSITGKPKPLDIADRKARLPIIHAIETLDLKEEREFAEIWTSKQSLDVIKIDEITNLLKKTNSIHYAMKQIDVYCGQAEKAVELLDSNLAQLKGNLRAITKLISLSNYY